MRERRQRRGIVLPGMQKSPRTLSKVGHCQVPIRYEVRLSSVLILFFSWLNFDSRLRAGVASQSITTVWKRIIRGTLGDKVLATLETVVKRELAKEEKAENV